jgi:hypothetical protein
MAIGSGTDSAIRKACSDDATPGKHIMPTDGRRSRSFADFRQSPVRGHHSSSLGPFGPPEIFIDNSRLLLNKKPLSITQWVPEEG